MTTDATALSCRQTSRKRNFSLETRNVGHRQNLSSTDVIRSSNQDVVHSTKSQLLTNSSRRLRSTERTDRLSVRINCSTIFKPNNSCSAEGKTDETRQKLLQCQTAFNATEDKKESTLKIKIEESERIKIEESERFLATIDDDDSMSSPTSTNTSGGSSVFCFRNLICLRRPKQNSNDLQSPQGISNKSERFDYEQLSMNSLKARGNVSGTFYKCFHVCLYVYPTTIVFKDKKCFLQNQFSKPI